MVPLYSNVACVFSLIPKYFRDGLFGNRSGVGIKADDFFDFVVCIDIPFVVHAPRILVLGICKVVVVVRT